MFKPEILAPGGSFNAAIHAFEAGADAVYIGMSSFSARKGAKNFTLESLRRLKSYVEKSGKKIYVALNTIIKDNELRDVIILLHHLSLIEVDGIILQDPGLAYIIKHHFPPLEIHASTQMAVHNSQGVQILKEEGFRRIILARELTLKEIREIRETHRDVELEVFIHGAMCYSFSGICLASGVLLGRSGNRGECGQVCRTWFDSDQGSKYSFSANDMKAGTLVKELQEMGIDSLKIEGRLKSPKYVSHTVSYYNALINDDSSKSIKEDNLAALAFSRNQTKAFFTTPKGENMINNQYTSHTGIKAGRITSAERGRFRLKCETDLSDRDGLLIRGKKENHQFALKSEGKKNHYRAGETITVILKETVESGREVFKISGHDMQLKEFKEESWKPWKTPLSLHITIEDSRLTISAETGGTPLTIDEEITLEKSSGGKDFSLILKENLRKSGTSSFTAGNLTIENRSRLKMDEIFLPLSTLKLIKKAFYKEIDRSVDPIFHSSADGILKSIGSHLEENTLFSHNIKIPPRSAMETGKEATGKIIFYPLPPLLFHNDDFKTLEDTIESVIGNPEKKIILGINNISHLFFAEKYAKNESVLFFTDYCTYAANRATALFYRTRIKRLLFSYYWIEDPDGSPESLRKIENDFNPHLFVSRICYKRHNNLGTCSQCSKNLSYNLKQRNKEFTVTVKDCITWLYQK